MLHFILGNSGSGKTRCLYETIIKESDQNPAKKYIMLVPDQFTMETQKELVTLHPGKSVGNIDILSFSRLAHRLFEEKGRTGRPVLDDTAKNFLIRRIISENEDKLKILNPTALKKIGCIDEIKSFISELMVYGVTPDDLARMSDESDMSALSLKLDDIYLIYEKFLEKALDGNILAEGILEEAGLLADSSDMLKGCVIAFDGFTGFTPVQLKFIEILMKKSSDVYVAVTVDENTDISKALPMHELYFMSVKMITELRGMAELNGISVDVPQYVKGEKRFALAPALSHLEKNIFRPFSYRYILKEGDKQINIFSASTPKDEMIFAARKIRDMVKEGYSFRDFAVVTGDAVGYENYAREVFDAYNIPVFLDETHNLVFHPFTDALRAIMQMAEEDYSYKSVFAYLRSGFSALDTEAIDRLENYVLSSGIRGYSSWNRQWKKKSVSDELLAVLNEAREVFVTEVGDIVKALKDKDLTVGQKTRRFYGFITEMKMGEALAKKKEEFESKGDFTRSREYAQIYETVLRIFEKLDAALGGEIISAEEYRKLLEAGFTSGSLGVLPAGKDSVIVGDIERTRISNVKVLFFAGVNDGIIPNMTGEGGVLSEQERRYLLGKGESIAYGARENAMLKNFYLYLTLTKPKERIYITYARTSPSGETLKKSYLIGVVENLFDGLSTGFIPSYDDEEFKAEVIYTPQSAFCAFANTVREDIVSQRNLSEDVKAGYFWYKKSNQPAVKRVIDSAFLSNGKRRLSDAKGIYGDKLKMSISKLEKYSACAYSYFLNYGLYLKERESYSFEAFDMGNIYHDAINILTGEIEKRRLSFADITEEDLETLTGIAIDAALKEYEDSALFSTGRLSYMAKRMRRVFTRTAGTVAAQIRAGRYGVFAHEEGFSLDYGNMSLVGKIDRIDAAQIGEEVALRVVDYKSSERDFSLNEFYEGLSLQLPLYMNAAIDKAKREFKGKHPVPGALLYFGMTDPVIESDADLPDEKIEEEISKKLKMKGYLNEDEDILKATDEEPGNSSLVAYFGYNKDGSLSKNSKVLSKEQFEDILKAANDKAGELGMKISAGVIDINPFVLDKKDGCKYCPYSAVCGFDKHIPGFNKRKLVKRDDDEVLELLSQRIREGAVIEEKT